jgi:hypothetical protein
VEQPSQLEVRSLDGKRHNTWNPEAGITIIGVDYDCSGCHLYVLLTNKTLFVCSNKLIPLAKVNLDKSYTSIAANPKEQNQITLGDAEGHVVVVRLKNIPN